MKWFYIDESITDGERRQGPYTIEEIHDFVNQGKITDSTLVWHSGEEGWKTWKEALEIEKKAEMEGLESSRDELLQNTINELLKEQIREFESKRFAGFFARALAYTIDNVILGLVGGVILFALGSGGLVDLETIQVAAANYAGDPTSGESLNKLIEAPGMSTFLTVWSIVQTIYFIVFHAIYSATPGKKLFHIHVETAYGEKLNWPISIARYLCSVLTQFTMFFYGLGYLIVLFDPKRRALHDWIARTFVVYDTPKQTSNGNKKEN